MARQQTPAKVEATLDRARSSQMRINVISTIRQGGLGSLPDRIDIPLIYGVDQCLSAIKIMRGRLIMPSYPSYLLEFCKISAKLQTDSLFLNYSNQCDEYLGLQPVWRCNGRSSVVSASKARAGDHALHFFRDVAKREGLIRKTTKAAQRSGCDRSG